MIAGLKSNSINNDIDNVIFNKLLENGADPDIKDWQNQTTIKTVLKARNTLLLFLHTENFLYTAND